MSPQMTSIPDPVAPQPRPRRQAGGNPASPGPAATTRPPAADTDRVLAEAIVTLLTRNHYRYSDETQLQHQIAQLLGGHGHTVSREVVLDRRSRIDLVVDSRIGLEIKVDGPVADVARQLQRYASTGSLRALVLATTCARHMQLPERVGGLPILVAYLPPLLA